LKGVWSLTVAYGSANYASYQLTNPWQVLWLLRITMFSAVWHAMSFFYLFLVFPRERSNAPRWVMWTAIPIAIITSAITLTPYLFSAIETVSKAGEVTNPTRGPAIALFGAVSAFLVIAGLRELVVKAFTGDDLQKKQSRVILLGASLTFTLILMFNLVLPLAFNELSYIPLAPVFFLPFILLTAHAIRKYRFLDTKIIATEILLLVLVIINVIELIIVRDLATLFLRIGVFSAVLAFGIMLIQSVVREVQQREHLRTMTQELEATNARLTELDKTKSQFLSFASHQLRTPLTTIKWHAQLLIDGTNGALPDPALTTAHKINQTADSLLEMVNEFLNLRKLQEGRMEYAFVPTDMNDLVAGIVESLSELAELKHLPLAFSRAPATIRCSVDRTKFSQVIQNLIDNALKYTDAGSVHISIEPSQNQKVRISVTDTGHGIDPDMIHRIFEQFVRDKKDSKTIEGTGLGLFIARQIVDAHHGRIWATSPGIGHGSTFTIELPTM
jgi:signal transduction histidine kinase